MCGVSGACISCGLLGVSYSYRSYYIFNLFVASTDLFEAKTGGTVYCCLYVAPGSYGGGDASIYIFYYDYLRDYMLGSYTMFYSYDFYYCFYYILGLNAGGGGLGMLGALRGAPG